MRIFNEIIKDPAIWKAYSDIEMYEEKTDKVMYHNFNHAMNVALSVKSILTGLGCDKVVIEEGMIAAILHDLGALHNEAEHAVKSFKLAKKYLKEKQIELVHEKLVLDAIITHNNGLENENLMALALIISDQLDIKSTRISKAGSQIQGFRQLNHMDDVMLNIKDDVLEINFVSNEEMNCTELEQSYFIQKLVDSVYIFAHKLSLMPVVNLNGKPWGVFGQGDL